MFEPKQLHIILIGHNSTHNYFINQEIIRDNFSFGQDVWLTNIFNGNDEEMTTGLSENNYIKIGNRGYQEGAFDLFKKGIEFAKTINRDYTIIMNYDVWVTSEEKFAKLLYDFVKSGKSFCTGKDNEIGRPLTDMIIFKTKDAPNLEEKFLASRMANPNFQPCFEEWMYYSLYQKLIDKQIEEDYKLLDEHWHVIDRGYHPRYDWSEKTSILHTHSNDKKQEIIKQQNLKGKYIDRFLEIRFVQQ